MDTPTDAVAHEQTPRVGGTGRQRPHSEQLRVATFNELIHLGQRSGFIEAQQWQTALGRMDDLEAACDEQATLRAELARAAAAQNWLFPDEAPPADPRQRLEVLVGRARAHARRSRVITQAYLSTLLALGSNWGLEHDHVAQALAHACVSEHWRVDWEIACDMEGLLGAELAGERQRAARSHAQATYQRRGRKGWLSQSDLLRVYSSLRQGVGDVEARELFAGFHRDANARRWAWAGASATVLPTDECLRLLVEKVAQQVHRTGRVPHGFRQAVVAEAAGAHIEASDLFEAIEVRSIREQWPVAFDGQPRLDSLDPNSWAPWAAERLRAALTPVVRPVAPSGLRMAMPLLAFLTVVSVNHPIAPSPVLSGSQGALAVAPPAVAVAAPPVIPASPAATPAPPVIQPLTLVVAHTDGVGARLRTAPATGPVARLLSDGTAVVVIGSEMQVGGTAWAQVRAPDGTPGWMSADFLSPSGSDPSAG